MMANTFNWLAQNRIPLTEMPLWVQQTAQQPETTGPGWAKGLSSAIASAVPAYYQARQAPLQAERQLAFGLLQSGQVRFKPELPAMIQSGQLTPKDIADNPLAYIEPIQPLTAEALSSLRSEFPEAQITGKVGEAEVTMPAKEEPKIKVGKRNYTIDQAISMLRIMERQLASPLYLADPTKYPHYNEYNELLDAVLGKVGAGVGLGATKEVKELEDILFE